MFRKRNEFAGELYCYEQGTAGHHGAVAWQKGTKSVRSPHGRGECWAQTKKAGKARQIIIKREEYVAGKSITVLKGSER